MTDRMALTDQDARNRITTDLDASLLVEAAAGTGKTTSMVARMTALLRHGHADIAQLAAMTFTVKAAGHLREKFEAALRRAVTAAPDAEERTRLTDALDRIDRPFIGTVHAFCATLLRERPLEARIDPGFIVLEEMEAARLQTRVFRDFIRGTTEAGRAAVTMLSQLALTQDVLRDACMQRCAHPGIDFASPAPAEPDLREAHAALLRFVDELGDLLPAETPGKREDALQRVVRSTLRQTGRNVSGNADIARLLTPFRGGAAMVKPTFWKERGAEAGTQARERAAAFATRYVEPALRRWEEYLYAHILGHAHGFVASWEQEKQRRGVLTNDDLLLRTRDMLRDHPGVREEIQRRWTHLLVDEFQDTDPVQAEIMLYITGEDTGERDWRRLRPRPGSLFVVGDPRQSIYRFRRADIGVYNTVAAIMEAAGPARLHLGSSFRTLPALCDWVNARFARVFPASESAWQAAHAPIAAVRSREGSLAGAYALPITYTGMQSPTRMLAEEAQLLARWTASALAAGLRIPVRREDGSEDLRPITAGDILLLTPTNAGIDAFAAAMEEWHIPVTVSGGYALRDRETLRPLMHILHALADPLDEISVVAFLRGPYCGADDAALADYRARGGQFTFFSPVVKEADPRILEGLAFLKGKVRLLRSLPPAAVVGSIIEEAGLMAWTASADRGNLRAGTLQRLVEFVQDASSRGHALAAIVSRLDAAMDGSRVDGMALFPGDNAVRIMNVHKAKGLEAPVVILARHDISRGRADRQTVCVDRRAHPPRGVMRIMQRFPGGGSRQIAAGPDWDDARAEEQRFLDAEHARLQYVAATRAESVLIVVRRMNASNTPDSWDILLAGALPDAPEFPLPRTATAAESATPLSPAEAEKGIARRREAAAGKGYALQSPSRLAHAGGSAIPPSGVRDNGMTGETSADGRAFGSAAHALFEIALRHHPGQATAALMDVAAEHALDDAQQERLRGILERVLADPLWERMRNAARCFTELPFGTPPGREASGPPAAMLGVIDVVFEEDGEWIIVDYKTDDVRDANDPRVAQYRLQVAAYGDAWEQVTGQRPRTLLWFVCTGLITG